MNTIDIVFGIILLLGGIQGFRKGLFVELASLIGLVLGIYGAIHFSYFVGDWLATKTTWSEQVIKLTAFAITFIIIVLVISLAGKILTKVANFAMLGVINKLAGAIFAILKYAFLLSVVLMFVDAADRHVAFIGEEQKESSLLYQPVQALAPAVLPSILERARQEEVLDSIRENPSEEEQNMQ